MISDPVVNAGVGVIGGAGISVGIGPCCDEQVIRNDVATRPARVISDDFRDVMFMLGTGLWF